MLFSVPDNITSTIKRPTVWINFTKNIHNSLSDVKISVQKGLQNK